MRERFSERRWKRGKKGSAEVGKEQTRSLKRWRGYSGERHENEDGVLEKDRNRADGKATTGELKEKEEGEKEKRSEPDYHSQLLYERKCYFLQRHTPQESRAVR